MKMLSIGCGYIGSVLAEELVRSLDFERLVVCDGEIERIEQIAKRFGEKILPLQLDISDYSNLLRIIDGVDLVIGLSPGRLGYNVMKACVEKRKNLVDLSYMAEDPFTLHKEALNGRIVIVPDCGVAPGLSNILTGKASNQLDEIDEVVIYVGGLPQKPTHPLDYKVTWCVEDLFEEYTRKARIVKNGETIEVEALDGLEEVKFKGLGVFEAFFTDGVRTMHRTVKAKNIWEKTLRYKGHADKIRLIREIGLLEKQPLYKSNLSPWEFMCRFWKQKLSFFEEKDFVLMKIDVTGKKNSKRMKHTFQMIDHFDEEKSITAMGRTTAYTAFSVIKLLIENKIQHKGVVAPEVLGMDKELSEEIMDSLRERKVKIEERVEEES